MSKKKLISTLAAVSLIGVIGVGATLAYFTSQANVNNVFTMGEVAGGIEEPNFPEDGTIENVSPNAGIVKDPTITLTEGSQDAYIRVKIERTGLSDEQFAQLEPRLVISGLEGNEGEKTLAEPYTYIGASTDWIKSGEYYYYQHIATAGTPIVFFNGVHIPAEWGNEMAKKTFELDITAEMVQANNFDSLGRNGNGQIDSWGSTVIEE